MGVSSNGFENAMQMRRVGGIPGGRDRRLVEQRRNSRGSLTQFSFEVSFGQH